MLQGNGFSPVCVLLWTNSEELVPNLALQMSQGKGLGFGGISKIKYGSWRGGSLKDCYILVDF
jgi:hypothetical protein